LGWASAAAPMEDGEKRIDWCDRPAEQEGVGKRGIKVGLFDHYYQQFPPSNLKSTLSS
jgi:hypothetical protein